MALIDIGSSFVISCDKKAHVYKITNTNKIREETEAIEIAMSSLCAACSLPILDQFLSKVLNKTWHNECVRCNECQKPMTEKCFSKNDVIYCKEDFDR